MGRIQSLTTMCLAALLVTAPAALQAQSQNEPEEAFEFEERSTLDTIQFDSVEEETLANTVIEGGLEAPAAGVPLRPQSEDDFYMDPLAMEPRDRRTEMDRSEVRQEFRLGQPPESDIAPVSIPRLELPSNRTYETLNINTTNIR